ncbi:MAG: hypothetical protein AB7K09_08260 [Planctomycetota bacterium]
MPTTTPPSTEPGRPVEAGLDPRRYQQVLAVALAVLFAIIAVSATLVQALVVKTATEPPHGATPLDNR